MTELKHYLQDGANGQARAVLMYLQYVMGSGIEESWSDEHKCYMARPEVARWENCREQGYVVSLRSKDYRRQLNIAFFEHRNSDNIGALKWEQHSLNSVNIDTAEFGDVYKSKWDISKSVDYGEIAAMAEWIKEELANFWKETSNPVKDKNDS